MVKFLNLVFLSLLGVANAEPWKFNVVSIKEPAYEMGLKYNGKIVKMKSETFPLFTTIIESGKTNSYKYVVLDKNGKVVEEESIERKYSKELASLNEVYNRENKNVKVPRLPKVYEPLYNQSKKFKEYDDSQIYTIYAKCDPTSYENLKHHPFVNNVKNDAASECQVTVISDNEVIQKKGNLQLIGYDSRTYKKLSWKIKLEKKINGRKTLKLRANANDVSFMRDKLSTELYRAVGVPTYSNSYARLIINNDVYGLYSLVDTIGGNFLSSVIHGDDKAHTGTSYKTYAGASLEYKGDKKENYSRVYELDELDKDDKDANGNDWYRLAHFTKLYKDWVNQYGNDQSMKAVTALEKFFNLESLLRQMVIESLTFAFDNFMANSGNYALYFNPEQQRYQIIPYDFDGSFYGSNGAPRFNKDYLKEPSQCINWAQHSRVNDDQYFIGNLFKHDIIKNRFNGIMKDALETFNPKAVSPMIDSLVQVLEKDIEWSYGLIDELDPSIPGYVNHFTLKNFINNNSYKSLGYYPKINHNDAIYGIRQWIDLRSRQCNTYLKTAELVTDSLINPSTTTTTTTTPAKKTTTTTTVVKKPTTTQVVKKPTTTQVVKKPTTTQVVKKPTTTQVVKKPTTTQVVKKTTTTQVVKKPTTTQVVKKPTTTQVVKKPTTTQVVKKPTTTTTKKNKVKPTKTVNKKVPVSTVSGRCGPQFGACRRANECCSKYNYCGTTKEYCGVGCQSEFGACTPSKAPSKKPEAPKKATTPKKNVKTTTTKKAKKSKKSKDNGKKVVTKNVKVKVSTVSGRCGPQFGACKKGSCCSKYNYCGTTKDYCGVGCQPRYGLCK